MEKNTTVGKEMREKEVMRERKQAVLGNLSMKVFERFFNTSIFE